MRNYREIRIRFIERDFWVNKIKSESPYIAEDEISNLLKYHQMMDVTMIFVPYQSQNGFATKFIDNTTNAKITLDDLNTAAFDFYIKQVTNLSVSQQKALKEAQEPQKLTKSVDEYINQIRNMLTKKVNIKQSKIAQ